MATQHDKAVLNSVFNPLIPIGECLVDDLIDATLEENEEETSDVIDAKRVELSAVNLAELGKIDEAIEILTTCIQTYPRRPSGYNNRAQAYRLKGSINAALQDLDKAIELSQGPTKSACLAYCQRALIYRFKDDTQAALRDFKKAADMGSEFAKQQLVQMNPYAALCNQMLQKVMAQLQSVPVDNECDRQNGYH